MSKQCWINYSVLEQQVTTSHDQKKRRHKRHPMGIGLGKKVVPQFVSLAQLVNTTPIQW